MRVRPEVITWSCRIVMALTVLALSGCARTLVRQRFEIPGHGVLTIAGDKNLFWSVNDGEGRFAGVSSNPSWDGNYVVMPFSGDSRTKLELSADFMLVNSLGHVAVAMWGTTGDEKAPETRGPMGMCFEGTKGKGIYKSLGAALAIPHSKDVFAVGRGDEDRSFHTMRMVLDRGASTIDYLIDRTLLGRIRFEGTIPPIRKIQIGIETPQNGSLIDVRFDNLRAKSSGDRLEQNSEGKNGWSGWPWFW